MFDIFKRSIILPQCHNNLLFAFLKTVELFIVHLSPKKIFINQQNSTILKKTFCGLVENKSPDCEPQGSVLKSLPNVLLQTINLNLPHSEDDDDDDDDRDRGDEDNDFDQSDLL